MPFGTGRAANLKFDGASELFNSCHFFLSHFSIANFFFFTLHVSCIVFSFFHSSSQVCCAIPSLLPALKFKLVPDSLFIPFASLSLSSHLFGFFYFFYNYYYILATALAHFFSSPCVFVISILILFLSLILFASDRT